MARNGCNNTAFNIWYRFYKGKHALGGVSLLLHIARLRGQSEHHS
jgi:hypothetical protein